MSKEAALFATVTAGAGKVVIGIATTASADDGVRAQLEQRIRLTARLIGDAGTGQRIADQTDMQQPAVQGLAAGR